MRNESIGLRRAARRAGKKPKQMPIAAEAANASSTASGAITIGHEFELADGHTTITAWSDPNAAVTLFDYSGTLAETDFLIV